MAVKTGSTKHLVIRFSNDLYGVGDPMREHRQILQSAGAVWLGKFGKPLSHARVDEISQQIEDGVTSKLFLVRRRSRRAGYEAFGGRMVAITRDDADVESALVPDYYDRLGLWSQVGFWAKLSTLETLPADGLDGVYVQASGMPIQETLRLSVAGLFIVGINRGNRAS